MVEWQRLFEQLLTQRLAVFLSILVFLLGLLFGYLVARLVQRFLIGVGLQDAVEGTPFERSVRGLGTSTVSLLSIISGLFVVVSATVLALRLLGVVSTQLLVARITEYFPSVFIAALAIILGLVVVDEAALLVSERLRSVKLPETGIVPTPVK